jgi:hypothetical protein
VVINDCRLGGRLHLALIAGWVRGERRLRTGGSRRKKLQRIAQRQYERVLEEQARDQGTEEEGQEMIQSWLAVGPAQPGSVGPRSARPIRTKTRCTDDRRRGEPEGFAASSGILMN